MLGEDRHYYSVPYQLVGKMVKELYCFKLVEIYYEHTCVTSKEL